MSMSMQPSLDDAINLLITLSDKALGSPEPSKLAYDVLQKRIIENEAYVDEVIQAVKDAFRRRSTVLKEILAEEAWGHNASLPIHRLPDEVLASILGMTTYGDYLNDSMDTWHSLAQVCKRWSKIIISDPFFWPLINVRHSSRTEMVLKRNKNNYRLVVWCWTKDEDEADEFLSKAHKHVDRWTSTTLVTPFTDKMKEMLEEPTPRLHEAWIWSVPRDDDYITKLVNISDGVTFDHVDLNGVAFPWDSCRIRGLQSLQLCKLDAHLPTICQLHLILSASPNLTFLGLFKWLDFTNGTAAGPVDERDKTYIELPELQTIHLQDIPTKYVSYLYTRIKAPNTKTLFVDKAVPASKRIEEATSILQLLMGVLREAEKVKLTYGTGGRTLRIACDPPIKLDDDTWGNRREDPEGLDVTFDLSRPPAAFWVEMREIFSSCLKAGQTTLDLEAKDFTIRDEFGDLVPTPELPCGELVANFPVLTHLEFGKCYDAATLLRYLAEQRFGPEGEASWPWSSLVSCDITRLAHPGSVARNILRFGLNRTEAAATASAEGTQTPVLKKLDAIWVPESISEMFSHVAGLRDVVKVRDD